SISAFYHSASLIAGGDSRLADSLAYRLGWYIQNPHYAQRGIRDFLDDVSRHIIVASDAYSDETAGAMRAAEERLQLDAIRVAAERLQSEAGELRALAAIFRATGEFPPTSSSLSDPVPAGAVERVRENLDLVDRYRERRESRE